MAKDCVYTDGWCTAHSLEEHDRVPSNEYEHACGCDYLKAENPRCEKHQNMMNEIHQKVWKEGKFLEETWALQDGYGFEGYTPVQGWDWSGIRDSSPSAIEKMYEVVTGGHQRN